MNATHTIPQVLTPQELASLLQARPDVRLLDVRTPGEYESMHVPGAYNVPLDTLGEHAEEIRATVSEPVVLICQSGARARRAETALKDFSMRNVHVLEGGMNAWAAAGGQVNRGPDRISLERQVRIAAGAMAATGGVLALLVNPLWALVPTLVGSGLVFAGLTDTCTMGRLLARLPYNRPAHCDVEQMVAALARGSRPATTQPAGQHSSPAQRNCAS
jgi:rhodanese-related sulfurtransferase